MSQNEPKPGHKRPSPASEYLQSIRDLAGKDVDPYKTAEIRATEPPSEKSAMGNLAQSIAKTVEAKEGGKLGVALDLDTQYQQQLAILEADDVEELSPYFTCSNT